MGVITTSELTAGMLFGPIPPSLTLSDPAVLIGHRTCDVPPDIHTVRVITCDNNNFIKQHKLYFLVHMAKNRVYLN